jgi:hypothetical protein
VYMKIIIVLLTLPIKPMFDKAVTVANCAFYATIGEPGGKNQGGCDRKELIPRTENTSTELLFILLVSR